MANSRQAKKRIRQTARRTEVNSARKSRVRTFVRKLEEAIDSGDREAAIAALQKAEPELMRGAQRGAFERRAASRKVSRLTRKVNQMSG